MLKHSWMTLTPALALVLAMAAAPAAAQTTPPAPQSAQPGARTASVNTAPRVDAAAMVRPIEMHDSVWIENLTMLEVRDLIKTGSTTALILTGGIEENGPYLTTGKHNNVLEATGESIARALGKTLVTPIVTLEPGNNAIRMPERVKAGKFVINGVPLAPIEKTIAHGKRMVEFRTQVTVAATRKAMGH